MKNKNWSSLLILVIILFDIYFIVQTVRESAQVATAPFQMTAEANHELQTRVADLLTGMPQQSFEMDFAQIDKALKESITASIAYNPPTAIRLNQTVNIELLLNPSLEPSDLATQIPDSSSVVTASIQITPRMRAVLISQEDDAFIIQPVHDNSEQLISTSETTKWSWDVTAKKGGTHRITMIAYRLVKFDGQEYWREVESYKADIDVKVTLAQRLQTLDWKWIAGTLLIPLVVFGWKLLQNRNKRTSAPPGKRYRS